MGKFVDVGRRNQKREGDVVDDSATTSRHNDEHTMDVTTNKEYLKNTMIRYFHAKTISERKTILSIIGAVLCLTEEEMSLAVTNIEAYTTQSFRFTKSFFGN